MLTNEYFLPFKPMKRQITEQEKNLLSQDEKYKFNLQMPMDVTQIKKIKNDKIHKFIDDIMCNSQLNHILYSSNAQKELNMYLKQKKNLLKVSKKKNPKDLKSLTQRDEEIKMYEYIKTNIHNFKVRRNRSIIYKQRKNLEFINSQPTLDKKLSKLYFKSMNETRLQGYIRAFKKCVDLLHTKKEFDLPDIEFKKNNVYSRLYNNFISPEKNKIRKNTRNRHNSIFETTRLTNIQETKNNNSNITENNIKKNFFLKFRLKRNIIDNEGKEFSTKITPEQIKQCWKNLSGGPQKKKRKEARPKNLRETNNTNSREKYDYKILAYGDSRNKTKDKMLFNTMISNDPNLDNKCIKMENFRDSHNNSNLHIAAKNNSIKLIKYFLNKRSRINVTNGKGETPLHIACKLGNTEMVELLINQGADTEVKDNFGRRPFDVTSKSNKNYLKIKKLFMY